MGGRHRKRKNPIQVPNDDNQATESKRNSQELKGTSDSTVEAGKVNEAQNPRDEGMKKSVTFAVPLVREISPERQIEPVEENPQNRSGPSDVFSMVLNGVDEKKVYEIKEWPDRTKKEAALGYEEEIARLEKIPKGPKRIICTSPLIDESYGFDYDPAYIPGNPYTNERRNGFTEYDHNNSMWMCRHFWHAKNGHCPYRSPAYEIIKLTPQQIMTREMYYHNDFKHAHRYLTNDEAQSLRGAKELKYNYKLEPEEDVFSHFVRRITDGER